MKIFTDSTSDISIEQAEKLGVTLIPLKVIIDGKEYIDKFEISNEEFFKRLEDVKELPSTALVNPDEMVSYFEKEEGDIVAVFLSSTLSGTYQSAVIAKEMLGRDNIYLVDSGSTTLGLALLTEKATQLRDSGITAAEVYQKLSEYKKRLRIYSVFDTLKYLVKGGRIKMAQGIVGTILGIKPIVTLIDGKIENIGKCRGIKKSVEFLIETMNAKNPIDLNELICFAYSKNAENLEHLKEKFANADAYLSHSLGSVVGAHAGPNAFAVAYFEKI